VLTQKKQRGWEYMRKLGNSPKVPRPRHKKANKAEQEAFKKALDEGVEAQRELSNSEGRALV
jgi:hypothetical protein